MAIFNNLLIILLLTLLSFNLNWTAIASPIIANPQQDRVSVRSIVTDDNQRNNQKNQVNRQTNDNTHPGAKDALLKDVPGISISVRQKIVQKNKNIYVLVIAIIGSILSLITGLLVIACFRSQHGYRSEESLNEKLKQIDDNQDISVWHGDQGADIETVAWRDVRESLSAVDVNSDSLAIFQDSQH